MDHRYTESVRVAELLSKRLQSELSASQARELALLLQKYGLHEEEALEGFIRQDFAGLPPSDPALRGEIFEGVRKRIARPHRTRIEK